MNNQTPCRHLRLPHYYDKQLLANDLSVCKAEKWKDHFNTRDYSGEWDSIALYSATGEQQDILTESVSGFKPTRLLGSCSYFTTIIDSLQCEKESVRLLRLAPGSEIHEHRDLKLAYEFGFFRLHIPIVTSEEIDFVVGGEKLSMQAGECWYANFDLPHSVCNASEQERVHLVIDGKRNAWTDELFGNAGYSFEAEEKCRLSQYDIRTIDNMIEGLRSIATETALKMIDNLLVQKKLLLENENSSVSVSKDFVPAGLSGTDGELSFEWIFTGEKRFTEPFFQETISACSKLSENKNRASTDLTTFFSLAETADAVDPSAFIFHISRCGSTLLSQMLATEENYIVLSEAPLLDEILRLPFVNAEKYDEAFSDRLFKAAIRLLGRRTSGKETHLFLKCDSWHIMFYERIRRCYPGVPFFFLYRSPDEVIHSQNQSQGMQALPGAIQPGIFGFEQSFVYSHPPDYFTRVLERYLQAYLEIPSKDADAFLLNYHDGAEMLIRSVLEKCGIAAGKELPEAMQQRTHFHSKNPGRIFSETVLPENENREYDKVMHLFRQLEQTKKISAG